LISSTNVTFTFARTSRGERAHERALAIGTVGANTMLFPRVLVATAVLNPVVVGRLALYFAAPALVGLLALALGVRRSERPLAAEPLPPNPLQLAAALQMTVLFQIVLMVVHAARERWGASGVFTAAAVLGLTDVDALTVSMAKDVAYALSPAIAAAAIAVGVLSNTAMKIALALLFGSPGFRLVAAGSLAVMLVALALALAVPML
jgi:uncharacterized membrane protein (DUF4010 family)